MWSCVSAVSIPHDDVGSLVRHNLAECFPTSFEGCRIDLDHVLWGLPSSKCGPQARVNNDHEGRHTRMRPNYRQRLKVEYGVQLLLQTSMSYKGSFPDGQPPWEFDTILVLMDRSSFSR